MVQTLASDVTFDRQPLSVKGTEKTHDFIVEMAITPEQQQQGLMHRTQLPDDRGMLFVFAQEQPAAMWMKNTKLALDMLFIDKHGRIVHVAPDNVPESTRRIVSPKPALAVLELPAGTAARLGIRIGDQVMHKVFTP